jgi:uncharacterized phage-associated protein
MRKIRFRTNTRKALEVILWFANKRHGIDFHSILKLLFFADKTHLNRWGRPIVGDTYRALPYGPVAQVTYEIFKCEPLALELLELDDFPFEVRNRYRLWPTREADLSRLSRSDIQALQESWDRFAELSFADLAKISHLDPAYHRAEVQGRIDIHYADFLEGENATPEAVAELEGTSRRMRV